MISILMPVYNGANYLRDAIDSILSQTYDDFEFIIINDGSIDNSEEIILSYNDPRIRYVKNIKNLKIVKTLNKGISLSNGKYIARMDSDDISLPTRLETQLEYLESNKKIGIVGSFYKRFGYDDNVIQLPTEDEEIRINMLFFSPFAHPAIMFRKDIVLKNNIFYEDYQNAEDYYFFYSLSKVTKSANIDKILLLYRVHVNQTSFQYDMEQKNNSDKVRCLILFEQFNASLKECEIHKLFVSNVVCDKYDFLKITSWAEKIICINDTFNSDKFRDVINKRYRDIFRKSARLKGPLLWPIYLRYKFRGNFTIQEFKFLFILFLSWIKNISLFKV